MAAVSAPKQRDGGFKVVANTKKKKELKAILTKVRKFSNERDFPPACEYYKAVIEIHAFNSEASLGLGWVYHKQYRHKRAIEFFRRSLEINETPLAFQGLMQYYYKTDDIETALLKANECIDFFPWYRKVR